SARGSVDVFCYFHIFQFFSQFPLRCLHSVFLSIISIFLYLLSISSISPFLSPSFSTLFSVSFPLSLHSPPSLLLSLPLDLSSSPPLSSPLLSSPPLFSPLLSSP